MIEYTKKMLNILYDNIDIDFYKRELLKYKIEHEKIAKEIIIDFYFMLFMDENIGLIKKLKTSNSIEFLKSTLEHLNNSDNNFENLSFSILEEIIKLKTIDKEDYYKETLKILNLNYVIIQSFNNIEYIDSVINNLKDNNLSEIEITVVFVSVLKRKMKHILKV